MFDTCIEKVHGCSASPLPPHLLAQILAKTAMGYTQTRRNDKDEDDNNKDDNDKDDNDKDDNNINGNEVEKDV